MTFIQPSAEDNDVLYQKHELMLTLRKEIVKLTGTLPRDIFQCLESYVD